MSDDDIIRVFALLEGLQLIKERGVFLRKVGDTFVAYNPLTDGNLTFKAMLDYEVQKITNTDSSGVWHTVHIKESSRISTLRDNELQKAIIICILKSENLWVGSWEDLYNDEHNI